MPDGAKDINFGPSLTKTHPHHDKWPQWINPCVLVLECIYTGPIWQQAICDWLELDGILGYPEGKVL